MKRSWIFFVLAVCLIGCVLALGGNEDDWFLDRIWNLITGNVVYSGMAGESIGNETVIFLHHSTGNNLFYTGNVDDWFLNYNENNGTNYQITERSYPTTPYPWNNYPYDYWYLWVNRSCNSADPDIECLEDIADEDLSFDMKKIAAQTGFVLKKHVVELTGLCARCAKKA